MATELIRKIIFGLTLSSIFLILVFLIIKIYVSLKYEKRIKAFTLDSHFESEGSLSDILFSRMKGSVRKLSKILSRSQVLKDYGKKFDKYLIYNTKEGVTGIHYVSLKFLFVFLIYCLYFITVIVKVIAFSFIELFLVTFVAFFAIDIVIVLVYKNHQKLLEEQLLQAVVIMNSAFKSGKNIYQAVQIVKEELPNPIKDELAIIAKDLSYGLDVTTVFERFYNRIQIEEAKYITSSLSLLSKTGGNIVTVFNMIEKSFYNRLKIRNELLSLTASARFLYRALCAMPFIFVFVIFSLNPSYFTSLYTTTIGYLLLGVIIILYVVYVLVIRKLMKVDEV